jgi:hypothetical protein
MNIFKKKTALVTLALIATGVLAMSGPVLAAEATPVGPSTPVSKDGVIPTAWTDNPNCIDVGYGFGFKVNQSPEGTFPLDGTAGGELTGGAPPDPYNSVTISDVKTKNGDEVKFDWSSTLGIDAVIVKGGCSGDNVCANVYVYVPEDTADEGLGTIDAASDISHIEFCYDYELTAEKTADTEYTRTYTWEITKDVVPASHTGWFGDEFTSSYDVFVDRTVTDSDYKVTGDITINNPTPFEVPFSVEDDANGTLATVTCPGDDYTLDAGETKICSYVAELGDALPADGTNTATITSGNGYVQGATATAGYAFGDPTTIVGYPTINVTDYFDGDMTGDPLGSASGDFTFEYDRTFACPTDEDMYTDGVYTDSFHDDAYIDETGQSDDADVDLTCYKPVVSKDADTGWFEQYDWTITKDVDPDSHTGFAGDEFASGYDVFVDQTITPYGYRAFGSIYVTNPSGEAITVDVSDAVDGTPATVDCDGDPDNGVETTSLTLAAGATGSCSYTVDLDSTEKRLNTAKVTISNGSEFEAYADVIFGAPIIVGYPTINVTDYFDGDMTGDPLGSASSDFTFEYDRTFECPTDEDMYTDGVYTDSFHDDAYIDETGQSDDADVDLTCYIPASAKVVKTTTEGAEDIGQFPFTFNLYDPSDTLVETQYLYTAGEVAFTTELRAEGTWTIEEILPDGWVSTTDLTCDIAIAYPGSADQTYTCTFDNVEMSRLRIVKTTNGVHDPTYEWNFAIFAGAHYGEGSGFLSDTPLATDTTFNHSSGMLDFDNFDLDPSQAYAVCEIPANATAGWTSEWSINGQTVPAYNPHFFDEPSANNGYHCVDFGAGTGYLLTPGETLTFDVNNSYPGGEPRTPGYWKNWSSCTGGGQYDKAVEPNDPDNEFWALDELLFYPGFTIGDLQLGAGQCQDAVNILDQRDLNSGKKMAKDAAYTLAMHLFAYELNQAAGACPSSTADAAASAGQDLLVTYGFDGIGGYLRPKGGTKDDYYDALDLAETLDEYNNGLLCGQ